MCLKKREREKKKSSIQYLMNCSKKKRQIKVKIVCVWISNEQSMKYMKKKRVFPSKLSE